MANELILEVDHREYCICRLEPEAEVPDWAQGPGLCSVTRTGDELSIVCEQHSIPEEVQADRGWKCLVVQGPLDFGLVGILAGLAGCLAAAGVPIFSVSSYDTDRILVKSNTLGRACRALQSAGYHVRP
ncbi:MAG: ACT domain-containing protein [Acidobacteriota bacterium]|nr:MAG: ACT domain-containing protein [Acidobacteriota bacterium]